MLLRCAMLSVRLLLLFVSFISFVTVCTWNTKFSGMVIIDTSHHIITMWWHQIIFFPCVFCLFVCLFLRLDPTFIKSNGRSAQWKWYAPLTILCVLSQLWLPFFCLWTDLYIVLWDLSTRKMLHKCMLINRRHFCSYSKNCNWKMIWKCFYSC